jgi:Uncharacterised nucleotidyltransferase
MTQLPNNLMTIFLELCDPFRQAISSFPSEEDWHSISELSKLHGVTSFLFYRARSLGIKLPEQIEKEWLGIYLFQIAEEQKARRQIKELKEILDPERIPFILLKGASAMLRLYPEPGLRTFCDLDILIPVDKVERFKNAMVKGGYKPLFARNSSGDEELQKFDVHLDPLWKEEGFMIEAYLNILGIKDDHSIANSDVWQDKEETNTDGIKVDHLSKEQFIVHTLLHSLRHLSDEGFSEIKWLIDLRYAVGTWRIDWSKVNDTSTKWGIREDILPVMATLNHYWQADIPLKGEVKPTDLQTLLSGIKDREKGYYAKLPVSYLERLLKLRKLPDKTSQIRYIFHLLFPTRTNLRWRYDLSSKWSIIPYYLVHLLLTGRKLFTGLWYQVLYHPR